MIANAQDTIATSVRFEVGENWILENISFDFDKPVLEKNSYPTLDQLIEMLSKHDSLVIMVGNHGDSRGSEAYCVRLTQKRAEMVRNYLINSSISADRVIAKGFGDTQLLIPDSAIEKMGSPQEKEKAHQTNRRTEVTIVSASYTSKK